MEPIKCFLLTPTNLYHQSLRRYHSSWKDGAAVPPSPCHLPNGHDASVVINERLELAEAPTSGSSGADQFKGDPRWPERCPCGYLFTDEDVSQVFYDHWYKRSDNGELASLRQAPVGAIWDNTWYPEEWKRPDGHHYTCMTPGGQWDIDGKCSNCTRKGEPHECWCRHGEAPMLTVDKNGDTCSAGGGSIIAGGWHGFLTAGHLVTC